MTENLGILRSSFVPLEKALFQTLELLVPAYNYIRPLSGMVLEADGSSRWLPGWREREVPP